MKVGDRIRVFEITEKGSDYYCENFTGKQSSEIYDDFFGNNYGVTLALKNGNKQNIHVGIDYRGHAKHVATMVITKIKNQ